MKENLQPKIEDTGITKPLIELENLKKRAANTAQSIDGSEDLAGDALASAFAKPSNLTLPPSISS